MPKKLDQRGESTAGKKALSKEIDPEGEKGRKSFAGNTH